MVERWGISNIDGNMVLQPECGYWVSITAYQRLEAELAECKADKKTLLEQATELSKRLGKERDDSLSLRAQYATLTARCERLEGALLAVVSMRRTNLAMTCPGNHDEECSHGEEFDSIIQHIKQALEVPK